MADSTTLWLAYVDDDGIAQLIVNEHSVWGGPQQVQLEGNTPLRPGGPLALAYDGAQTLWLAYVQSGAIFVSSATVTPNLGHWSAPQRAGTLMSGADAVTLCSDTATLYVGFLDAQHTPTMTSRDANGNWSNPLAVLAAPAAAPPGVTIWNGAVWFAVHDANAGELRLAAYRDGRWSATITLATNPSAHTGASIAGVGTTLWVAHVGAPGDASAASVLSSGDGVFWSAPVGLPGPVSSAPSMFGWGGQGWVGTNASAITYMQTGSVFIENTQPYPGEVGDVRTPARSPAVATA
jgi:hypothetical protein